jgi:hypothetical protein
MPGFNAPELSMLVVALARLEYRPPAPWLEAFAARSRELLPSFGAQVGEGRGGEGVFGGGGAGAGGERGGGGGGG